MQKSGKKNYMTVLTAIRELEKVELIRQSDLGYRMDYAVTATQKEILKAFNMTATNIRTQAAAMNEDLMQIEKEGGTREVRTRNILMILVDMGGSLL